MAFTREKLKGRVGVRRITSDGSSVVTSAVTSKIPLVISSANKLQYPGALSFTDFDIAFTASWTDDAAFSTTIVESVWFRNTNSTTT
jgi:hypothetical protein